MGKKLSTYKSDENKGYAEVHVDMKQESFYIKYFDNNGKRFFTEDFEGKSLRFMRTLMKQCPSDHTTTAFLKSFRLGIKKLDIYNTDKV